MITTPWSQKMPPRRFVGDKEDVDCEFLVQVPSSASAMTGFWSANRVPAYASRSSRRTLGSFINAPCPESLRPGGRMPEMKISQNPGSLIASRGNSRSPDFGKDESGFPPIESFLVRPPPCERIGPNDNGFLSLMVFQGKHPRHSEQPGFVGGQDPLPGPPGTAQQGVVRDKISPRFYAV